MGVVMLAMQTHSLVVATVSCAHCQHQLHKAGQEHALRYCHCLLYWIVDFENVADVCPDVRDFVQSASCGPWTPRVKKGYVDY